MKCSQKLCNRYKNLNSFGNCEVCEEVMKETKKKYEKVKDNKVRVEVDVKHMISMQRKLLNVEKVDPLEVSYLVLAGIINILAQHDRIEEIDEKLKDV